MHCAACNQEITTLRKLNCLNCNDHFHPICVNVATTNPNELTEWLCPGCRAKEPKKDNSTLACASPGIAIATDKTMTPARSHKRPAIGSPETDNSPQKNVNKSELDTAYELRLLRHELAEMKMLLTDSVSKCFEKLDCLEIRLKAAEEKSAIIPTLQNTICNLQEQLNHQNNINMRNEIEIIGIPENPKDNLVHTVMIIASKTGTNLTEVDIDSVNRIGKRHTDSSSQRSDSDVYHPRPVILRFSRRLKRDEFLRNAKSRRGLTSSDIDVQGAARKIYINEHLPKASRLLFREARTRAKEHGYRFCWISNAKVQVRRAEGHPAITIRSHDDLDKLTPLVT